MAYISVVGAGLIGRKHIKAIASCPDAQLHSIVDPAEPARALARDKGVAWFPDISSLFEKQPPDGVILATPNQMHLSGGVACIEARVPVLVEKPLCSTVSEAEELILAAAQADIPVMTGHHRRHNPVIGAAKAMVESGDLGEIVSVNGMFWLCKPDDYFNTSWRRQSGAGPLLINLIHDVDLMRHLVGEVQAVTAVASSRTRGFEVEDTAVVIMQFSGGALGTFNISDTIAAPWSWELTSGENPDFPQTDQACYVIGGTKGSLELPAGRVWSYPGARSWLNPIAQQLLPVEHADPLVRQVANFCAVIAGNDSPLVSGAEGLATLRVLDAIKRSAETGERVIL